MITVYGVFQPAVYILLKIPNADVLTITIRYCQPPPMTRRRLLKTPAVRCAFIATAACNV